MDAIKQEVWFVYDGECPLCMAGATYYRIKEAVGRLHLLDAREHPDHPLMHEINARGLNLDEGMVLKVGSDFYQGDDALHRMALLASDKNRLNKIMGKVFRSKALSKALYPSMKAARNGLLRVKGVPLLNNLKK